MAFAPGPAFRKTQLGNRRGKNGMVQSDSLLTSRGDSEACGEFSPTLLALSALALR